MSKIVIIHHSGLIGGAGISLLNTVRSLSRYHSVSVFVSGNPTDMLMQLEALQKEINFELVNYGKRIGAMTYYSGGDKLTSARFFYRTFLVFKQWRMWEKYIGEINPDIVIVNSIILSWMSMLPEIKKRKSVCFVRETINGNPSWLINRLFRKFLLKFTKVSFLSEYDKKSWNFPDKKSVVIRNYIETSLLDNTIIRDVASNKLGVTEKSWHLLYAGGVSRMKGFDLAVRAVVESRFNVELIAAGIDFQDRENMCGGKLPEYEQSVRDYIEKNDKEHRVHLVGRQMNMSNCFAAADALIFPMRSAHQARPVFEAGWYSIPAIITDFENIREDVQDKINGLTFENENWEEIKLKMEYLISNPDVAKEMGQNNYRMTVENHSKCKNSQQIVDLINELV